MRLEPVAHLEASVDSEIKYDAVDGERRLIDAERCVSVELCQAGTCRDASPGSTV